jgi:hypothetical protein
MLTEIVCPTDLLSMIVQPSLAMIHGALELSDCDHRAVGCVKFMPCEIEGSECAALVITCSTELTGGP